MNIFDPNNEKVKEWCKRVDAKVEKWNALMNLIDKKITRFAIRLWTEVGKEILFLIVVYGTAEILSQKLNTPKDTILKTIQILAFVIPTGFYIYKKAYKKRN